MTYKEKLKDIFNDIKITEDKIIIPKKIIVVDIKSRIDDKSNDSIIKIIENSLDKKTIVSKTHNGIHFWFKTDIKSKIDLDKILNSYQKLKNNYLSLEVSYHDKFIWNKKREYKFNNIKSIEDIDRLSDILKVISKEDSEIIQNVIGIKKWKTTIRDFLKEYNKVLNNETIDKGKIEDLFLEMFNYFIKFKFEEDKEDNYNYVYKLFKKTFTKMFSEKFELDIPYSDKTILYSKFLELKGEISNNNYSTFKKIGSKYTLLENEIIYKNYSMNDLIDFLTIEKLDKTKKILDIKIEKEKVEKEVKKLEIKRENLTYDSMKFIIKKELDIIFLTQFGYEKFLSKRVGFDNDIFIQLLNKTKLLKLNKFEITIDSLCDYLVNVCGYIFFNNNIYIWDKTHYNILDTNSKTKSKTTTSFFSKIVRFYETLKITSNLTNEIKTKIEIKSKLKNIPENYIPLKNGILDLTTMTLLNSDEGIDYNIFSTFNVNFDKNFNKESEDYKIFDKFMSVPLNEKKLKELYYLMSCSVLFPKTYLKRIFFLIGASNSGKSILLRWIRNILPLELTTSFNLEDLDKDRWAKGYLNNSWVNIQGDIPVSKEAINGKTIKSITGGDSITVEKKYQDLETNVIINTKIIVSSNHQPNFKTDAALYNRLILLKIDNVIDKNNKEISDIEKKVLDEGNQIRQKYLDIFFNNILSYYSEMKRVGVNKVFDNENIYPKSSIEIKNEIIDNSNILHMWMEEEDITVKDFIDKRVSYCLGSNNFNDASWENCLSNFCRRTNLKNWYTLKNWRIKMNEVLEGKGYRLDITKSNGNKIIRVWDLQNKKYLEKTKVKFNYNISNEEK